MVGVVVEVLSTGGRPAVTVVVAVVVSVVAVVLSVVVVLSTVTEVVEVVVAGESAPATQTATVAETDTGS